MARDLLFGFGPILVFALIGFLYVWFSTPKKPHDRADAPEGVQPSSRR